LRQLPLWHGSAVGATSCVVIERLEEVLSWIKVIGRRDR
jgi:hypothetical protein